MKICVSEDFYDDDNMLIGYGREFTQEDMDEIARWMDDDIREDLHLEMAPCTPEEFLSAYLKRDPSFRDVLLDQFDMDQDEVRSLMKRDCV